MPNVILPGGKGSIRVDTAGRRSIRAQQVLDQLPGGYSLVRRNDRGELAVLPPNEEVLASEVLQALPVNTAGAGR